MSREADDLRRMIGELRPMASERKARLCFAAWLLDYGWYDTIPKLVRNYVDGEITYEECESRCLSEYKVDSAYYEGIYATMDRGEYLYTSDGTPYHFCLGGNPWGIESMVEQWGDRASTCEEIRGVLFCHFGEYPFRKPAVDPAWLAWGGGMAARMAQVIYSGDGPFNPDLPVLGDVLEEAGCTDAEMLAHCRNGDVKHWHGCWVVDAVLGKR